MRQGITTKYIGPTNSRGSRIKAVARVKDSFGKEMSLTVPYGYGPTDEEHGNAARALARKLGWSGLWVAGGAPDNRGNMYVNAGDCGLDLPTRGEGKDWFWVDAPNPDHAALANYAKARQARGD